MMTTRERGRLFAFLLGAGLVVNSLLCALGFNDPEVLGTAITLNIGWMGLLLATACGEPTLP